MDCVNNFFPITEAKLGRKKDFFKGRSPINDMIKLNYQNYMDKVMKKILTNKTARNASTISAFVLAVSTAGFPWAGK